MSIDKISEIALETDFKAEQWVVPPLPPVAKIKDQRGFIYIVVDTKYPELLKVGKTIDFVKRVKTYNVDRPYEDVRPVLCTRLIQNVEHVERHLKNFLGEKYGSAGKSQEWFNVEAFLDICKILEEEYDHSYTLFGEPVET